MEATVRSYCGLVATLAEKIAASPRAKQVGAEYDDIYQEGLISVWQSVQRGVNPALVVENRMRDWLRYLGRQNPVAYEQMLPLEDFGAGGAR